MGFCRNGEILSYEEFTGRPSFGFNGFFCPKGYASVAEAEAALSIDVEEDVLAREEVQELLQEMNNEEKRQV